MLTKLTGLVMIRELNPQSQLLPMSTHHLLLASIGPLGTSELLVILVLLTILTAVIVLPFWFICKKAGLSPWLSLMAFIPMGALILPFLLAFIDWPALKRDTQPSGGSSDGST